MAIERKGQGDRCYCSECQCVREHATPPAEDVEKVGEWTIEHYEEVNVELAKQLAAKEAEYRCMEGSFHAERRHVRELTDKITALEGLLREADRYMCCCCEVVCDSCGEYDHDCTCGDDKQAEIERLRGRLFIKARTTATHEKGYTDDEMLEMFEPFLIRGETTGLDPRECRLIEAVADRNAEIELLRKSLQSKHEYGPASPGEQEYAWRQYCQRTGWDHNAHPSAKSAYVEGYCDGDCHSEGDTMRKVRRDKITHLEGLLRRHHANSAKGDDPRLFADTKKALGGEGDYKCNNCGFVKDVEEEIVCWECGNGEMSYQKGNDDG